MSVGCQNAGALVLVLAGFVAGCSPTDTASASSPGDEAWTRTAPTSDAGDASDAEEPPEQLCALRGPPASTPGDTLVYGEEFDGATVDTKKWTVSEGTRGPSNILSTTSPSGVVVRDGSLFVTANHDAADPSRPYATGYLETLGKFARTYGKVEFRARFPYAAGVWHAMWGRAWFDSFPEIDIEILNTAAVTHSQIYFVNHWAAPPVPDDQRRVFAKLDDYDASAFHTYTVSWTPGLLDWAIDGVSKLQSRGKGVPTKPVYWIVNSWVGGWAGTPPASTAMPVTFEVDYMRIYRVDGLIADPAIHVASTATKYARKDRISIAVANFDEACAHVEMYDGETLLRTTSTAPYGFSLARLAPGPHKLTFVATDGVRRTSTTIDAQIL